MRFCSYKRVRVAKAVRAPDFGPPIIQLLVASNIAIVLVVKLLRHRYMATVRPAKSLTALHAAVVPSSQNLLSTKAGQAAAAVASQGRVPAVSAGVIEAAVRTSGGALTKISCYEG